MGKDSSLKMLLADSRMSGLSPDAATGLHALAFKIAREREMGILPDEEKTERGGLQELYDKAAESPFMD